MTYGDLWLFFFVVVAAFGFIAGALWFFDWMGRWMRDEL